MQVSITQACDSAMTCLCIRHSADVHSRQAHAVAQVHALAALPADDHLLHLEPARSDAQARSHQQHTASPWGSLQAVGFLQSRGSLGDRRPCARRDRLGLGWPGRRTHPCSHCRRWPQSCCCARCETPHAAARPHQPAKHGVTRHKTLSQRHEALAQTHKQSDSIKQDTCNRALLLSFMRTACVSHCETELVPCVTRCRQAACAMINRMLYTCDDLQQPVRRRRSTGAPHWRARHAPATSRPAASWARCAGQPVPRDVVERRAATQVRAPQATRPPGSAGVPS